MMQLRAIIDAGRPRQWLKNLLLFVPIVFAGKLSNWDILIAVSVGMVAFCLLSSSNYIINDIIDVDRDRKHPFKRHRAVARRALPENQALLVAIALLIAGLAFSYGLGVLFFLSACTFVLLHWLLYYFFRSIPVIDVLSLAAGYVLRVYAGESLIGMYISIWLFLSVLSFSLLLAIGKRRAELSFLQDQRTKPESVISSKGFKYSEKLLDAYVAVFANATFLTYAYYTFLATPENEGVLFRGALESFIGRKWMMVTVPIALYGIMRYLQIVYTVKSGTLEKTITADKPLAFSLVLWIVVVLFVVYGIGG
jgi:4-hydroxybenzoate polyprenyltransferase